MINPSKQKKIKKKIKKKLEGDLLNKSCWGDMRASCSHDRTLAMDAKELALVPFLVDGTHGPTHQTNLELEAAGVNLGARPIKSVVHLVRAKGRGGVWELLGVLKLDVIQQQLLVLCGNAKLLVDLLLEVGDGGLPGDLQSQLSATGLFKYSDLNRKSTRLNSSHSSISYAVFCLKKT